MWLYVSKLVYRTLQGCRHSRDISIVMLPLARHILAEAESTRRDVVSLPPRWAHVALAAIDQSITAPPEDAGAPPRFSSAPNPIWPVLGAGLADLERLWAAGDRAAVRALGYAFHNLPANLYAPESFDPARFQSSLSIVATFWPRLSPPLHDALCALAQLERPAIERLIATEGWCTDWG
jgi:hypothetical protein